MNRPISNSMSKSNDPHFEVITPVCKACVNLQNNGSCKEYGERPKDYKYGRKFDCPKRNLNKNNINYNEVKDKL